MTKLNGLIYGKSFMAGEITWIDFAIADFIQILGLFSPNLISEFPQLKAYQERIWSLPELKNYF
jgi:glutathione S-transferase